MLHRGVLAALVLVTAVGEPNHRAGVALDPPSVPFEAVYECYRKAHRRTVLDRTEVNELCEGAQDAGPADCYVDAHARTFLSVEDAISLCRCATSTAPVACYREGFQTTTLDRAEIQRLCSPSLRLRLRSDCSPEP
jgi:hypothetical protein